MPELCLKVGTVGPDPAYQDGDILAAFNRRAIRCAHAHHICHPKLASGGVRVHRDNNHVSRDFYELTHQYRFERVSRTEAKRVDLATLDEVVFDNRLKIVNGEKFAMDVPLFIERRLRHNQHMIFGLPGAEIWYGGRKDFSDAKLDLVWNAIETKTAFREVNFPRWPAGREDLRSHLFVTCDDFTDAEAAALVASEHDLADPDNPILGKKRTRHIDWRDVIPTRDHAAIEDKTRTFDTRETMTPLDRGTVVKTRQAVARL